MKKKYIVILLIWILIGTGKANTVSMAFIGIDGEYEPEFTQQLIKSIYQKIIYLPGLEIIDSKKISHLRDMNSITSSVLSPQNADSIAKALQTRTILYGKIEKTDIIPHRLWFFPVFGYYQATMNLHLWLYDSKNKNFRYNDKLSLSCKFNRKYCGFGDINKNMTLTASSRTKIQETWIQLAQEEVAKRVDLNIAGLKLSGKPEIAVVADTVRDATASDTAIDATPAGADTAVADTGVVTKDASSEKKEDAGLQNTSSVEEKKQKLKTSKNKK